MASARVLTTNELGIIRYQKAAIENRWPIEVRLLPQLNDTPSTIYSLHTPGNLATPFIPTKREELRATLAVAPGALVYEVLRDGLLVSTGGLEVRQPLPIPDFNHYQQQQHPHTQQQQQIPLTTSHTTASTTTTITTSTSTSSSSSSFHNNKENIYYNNTIENNNITSSLNQLNIHSESNLSGAYQISIEQGAYSNSQNYWPITFQYNELAWTIRQVAIIDESNGYIKCILTKNHMNNGFIGQIYLPCGIFHYRFKVIPDESLHTQIISQPTCLGWDDGAMTHAWELMTWPLSIHVVDLSIPGTSPVDGLMRLEKLPKFTLTDISHINDDDDDLDDDEDDEIVIHPRIEIEEEIESTNNNMNMDSSDDIQLNLNNTRFKEAEETQVNGMTSDCEESLINSLESTSIHNKNIETEVMNKATTIVVQEEKEIEESKIENDIEEEYQSSNKLTNTTITTSSNMMNRNIESSIIYEGNKVSSNINEEQSKSILNGTSNRGRKISGLKKKERKNTKNGWSGFALNAVMFILGSTVTIMMGNARRRNKDSDSNSSTFNDKHSHINMDADMDCIDEMLTDINNNENNNSHDSYSEDSIYLDRRKSSRRSVSQQSRKAIESENDSSLFANRFHFTHSRSNKC